MSDSDPWLGVTWKVYAVQGVDGPYLKPTEKEGVFTLTPVSDNPAGGQTAYYTVDFADGAMPACWRGVLFYPRGTLEFAPPTPPLQAWTPSGDAPWLAAADAVRQGLSVAMARLEADLCPDANPKSLTLVCVSDATTSGTPLLVQQLMSKTSTGQVQPMDSPTGGGHGDN